MLFRHGIRLRPCATSAILGSSGSSSARWPLGLLCSRGVSDDARAAGDAAERSTRQRPATRGGRRFTRQPKDGSHNDAQANAETNNLREKVAADFKKRREDLQKQSSQTGKLKSDWRNDMGHEVPYRFRLEDLSPREGKPPVAAAASGKTQTGGTGAGTAHEMGATTMSNIASRVVAGMQKQAGGTGSAETDGKTDGKNDGSEQKKSFQGTKELPYSDYSGLRFPTLETAENYDYHKDRGFDRIKERSYPIKVPGHRRLDPYFREYIYFLHNLDPARFTIARIAERYRLRGKTVAKVVKEWGVNRYLTRSGLCKLRNRLETRESVVLARKEQQYGKWVGWDQLGDEDDPETDNEALGEFKGWRSTNDWVRRQNVEVEMMSAFPMMEKRDPMPKRVDVDLVVDNQRHHKIINWIDPTDKVVF